MLLMDDYTDDNDNSDEIVSRWFVLDATRTRKNQYKLVLMKDVIADNYTKIITAPAFLNKAIIKYDNDPAIYNKEDIKTNQIKVSEYPVVEADASNGRVCPVNWIVGYATKQADNAAAWTEEDMETSSVAGTYGSWSNFPLNSIVTETENQYKAVNTNIRYVGAYVNSTEAVGHDTGWYVGYAYQTDGHAMTTVPDNDFIYKWNSWANERILIDNDEFASYLRGLPTGLTNNTWPGAENPTGSYGVRYRFDGMLNLLKTNANSNKTALNNYLTNDMAMVDNVSYDTAASWDQKTIKVGTKYYLLTVQSEDVNYTAVADGMSPSLVSALFNGYQISMTGTWTGTPNYKNIMYGYQGKRFNIYAREVAQPTVKITPYKQAEGDGYTHNYKWNSIPYVNDAPYAIFAIPYTEEWHDTWLMIQANYDDGVQRTRTVDRDRAFTLAQYIAKQLQEGQFLVDMQILPYAPFDINMYLNDCLRLNNPNTHGHLFYTHDSGTDTYNAYYPCFFAEKSDFKHLGGVWNGSLGNSGFANVGFNQSIIDKKIMNQTELFRFNSPSKSQFYDFNPAANNGLSTVYIDFTYKPYQPFIYIRPKNYTNSLYGNNNHDYIGLIATGDYSMPLLNDQWKTYQIQNKNFQKTFDRQVQHQEFENKWSLAESITNMFTAPLQGAVSGAAGGSAAGPYGAIAGAIVGGVVGQAGAIGDLAHTISSQKENMSYMKDMFNYSIENIQALPDTLSSTTGFDCINKIYPFVEHYTCFDKEKEAVRNKIIYSGMSIKRIDTINNFEYGSANAYTEGILIRLEGIEANPMEVNEINNELMKGVYL